MLQKKKKKKKKKRKKIHISNTVLKTLNSHRIIHGMWDRVPFGNCPRKMAIFVDI